MKSSIEIITILLSFGNENNNINEEVRLKNSYTL
jgi:hypothetical protein